MAIQPRHVVGDLAARQGTCVLWGQTFLPLVIVAVASASCANQQKELLQERCAQLANLGYRDQGQIITLLRANGQPVAGGEQSLRRAAKQFCGAHG